MTALHSLTTSEAARAASAVLRAAADVTLFVDRGGVVRDVHLAAAPGEGPDMDDACGARAVDVVREEDRPAFARLVDAARRGRASSPVEVRHGTGPGGLFRYTALLPPGRAGEILLVGRLLSPGEGLAARMTETRLAIDRDTLARRATEARYRMLFETAAEGILIASLESAAVEEANPRALSLIDAGPLEIVGRPVASLVADEDRARVEGLIASARSRGEAAPLSVTFAASGRRLKIDARIFRAFDRAQMMLRLSDAGGRRDSPAEALVAGLLRSTSDAVALTDPSGTVIWANEAFRSLSAGDLAAGGPADRPTLAGTPLADLVEGPGPMLRPIVDAAREHGRVSWPGARLRRGSDGTVEGDLTVIAIPERASPGFGVFFRPSRTEATAPEPTAARAAEITMVVGQAPLRDVVRDAADIIERSCIEAALRLTRGNKAAAAEVLGLSRQSLYLKLHRFGLL